MPSKIAKTTKGEERRRSLLTHAIDVFIELGYEGATLERVIARAGGSRSTIYQCYGNKQGLFIASLQFLVDEVYSAYMAQYRPGRDLRDEFLTFGKIFLTGMLADRAIAASRLILAETVRFPMIGEWFYREGAMMSYHCFAKVLENHLSLPMNQLEALSLSFIEMLKGGLYQKKMCLPAWSPNQDEIENAVNLSTDIILAYIHQKTTEGITTI